MSGSVASFACSRASEPFALGRHAYHLRTAAYTHIAYV